MRFAKTMFAAALALSLAPLAANARPDMYHDHGHRPPPRMEHRPPMPHDGHYRWREGAWGWHGNAWTWTPGIWIRF